MLVGSGRLLGRIATPRFTEAAAPQKPPDFVVVVVVAAIVGLLCWVKANTGELRPTAEGQMSDTINKYK